MNSEVPKPFRFNAFKHHRAYLLSVLKNVSAELVDEQLLPVCNNYVDVYTGNLTITEICRELEALLRKGNTFEASAFQVWVKTPRGYRDLLLSDGSVWIIREGGDSDRYIHLHPARTGPHVVRYRGSTLKTVFMLKLDGNEEPGLADLNRLRQQIGLSPVRKLEPQKGILKCYREFFRE
ncbi:hypothetical protein [Mangrovibacterium lignilyticum]|uniref:hypothetical protein n=1 Tax=Mangrovibacterium lignilyticum TaxID=2668052 RepID=UPI0013D16363|nr:hypothetical protein [Mangrovibacterium lignilyticum]